MLLVDTADRDAIGRALEFPGVQGFTTNPALMASAAGVDALAADEYVAAARGLCRMSAEIGAIRHLMIQAIGGPDETLKLATLLLDDLKTARDKTLWIKLAPTRTSLTCCRTLKDVGCASLATAVFTATQAYVAMESGADGVAVYLGRLMRLDSDWEKRLETIAAIVKSAGRTLLLASFPDRETVDVGLRYSLDITIPPSVLEELLTSALSQAAIEAFENKIAPTR
ncbi:MAG: transaldolase family protein [Methylocystis sp.]|uniref:transaldolase family protein n=1 Tax=Methylocystis sp. TaxID=1911079 RepID=UPI003D0E3571